MVGPTRVSPKKSPRIGAPTRANSSLSTTFCMVVRPLPPYSLGHEAQIQPPSKSFSFHFSENVAFSSAVISRSPQSSGRFASSQARISPRNVSASSGYVRSMCQSWEQSREAVKSGRPGRST